MERSSAQSKSIFAKITGYVQRFPFRTVRGLVIPYWFYLAATSQMLVVHDAVGYEDLGKVLLNQGWEKYIHVGADREPIYPLLISAAMGVGRGLGVSYQSILVVLQLLILFVSQFLLLSILRRLKVRPSLVVLAGLYFGYSPAIVNAALSSFSEIAAFPFILGIVWMTVRAWERLQDNEAPKTFWVGFGLGACFVLASLVKGIYEIIFPLFLFVLIGRCVYLGIRKDKKLGRRLAAVCLAAALSFYVPVLGYKFYNFKKHGNFSLTGRGAQILYHSASLRSEHMTSLHWISAVASIPGIDYCQLFLKNPICDFWGTVHLESYGDAPALQKTLSELPSNERDKTFRKMAFEKIADHPVQFFLFTAVDTLKLFFWESTSIGFVIYPHWLKMIFQALPVRLVIRFVPAVLSLMAWFWLLILYGIKCAGIQRASENPARDVRRWVILCVLWLILLHCGLHGLLAAFVPRHALPVASLYLICIAVWLDEVLPSRA